MIVPNDLYRMLARRFFLDGLKRFLPGGLWTTQGAAGRSGDYAVSRIESDDGEGLTDGRFILKGSLLLDVWTGGAGKDSGPAVRSLAQSFQMIRLKPLLIGGNLLKWKPGMWQSGLDAEPEDGADVSLTGLAWQYAVETTRG